MTEEPGDAQVAVLEAAALLLRERTFDDISYLDLAKATGVSERTIYRRFPTRSHFLEALARWIDANRLPLADFGTPEGFREAVRARFRAYEASPADAFVTARGAALSPTAESPATVTASIVAMLDSAAPTLNRRDSRRIAATARVFASPIFWARMRTGFDMSGEETAEAFDRAMLQVLATAPEASWAA